MIPPRAEGMSKQEPQEAQQRQIKSPSPETEYAHVEYIGPEWTSSNYAE